MSFEIVKPVEVNGIEFYVSSKGDESGLSQTGIANLSGKSRPTIQDLLTEIERLEAATKDSSFDENSTAQAHIQKAALAIYEGFNDAIYLKITSPNQAKVVNSKLASRIIRYYAYHAPKCNATAIFSYDKFADTGMGTWIKEVTNFVEAGDMYSLMASMNSTLLLLNTKVEEMSIELKKTSGYRAASVQMEGLREWMESIEQAEFHRLQLPGEVEEELFTLNEWAILAQDGLVLSKSNKHSLANIVSSTYKSMELNLPTKVRRLNEKGYKLPGVQAYPRRHFVLINMCYAKLVSKN